MAVTFRRVFCFLRLKQLTLLTWDFQKCFTEEACAKMFAKFDGTQTISYISSTNSLFDRCFVYLTELRKCQKSVITLVRMK